jgi:hypothetical protein
LLRGSVFSALDRLESFREVEDGEVVPETPTSFAALPVTLTSSVSVGWGIVCRCISRQLVCHTCFSEENQVHTYMHARIKFHAYSDIKVYTETVSRKKKIIRDLRFILEMKAPNITGNRLGVAYA